MNDPLLNALKKYFGEYLINYHLNCDSGAQVMSVMGMGSQSLFQQMHDPVYSLRLQLTYSNNYLAAEMPLTIDALRFGPHGPRSMTHARNYRGVTEVVVDYVISDIDEFIVAVDNTTWERYNQEISVQIDKAIND